MGKKFKVREKVICPFIVATFYCHHRSCHGKDRLAPGDVFNWRHLGANAGRQGTRRVQRTAAAAAESGRWYNNLAKYLFAPLLHTLANFPIGKQTVVTVCVRMKTLRILSLSLSLSYRIDIIYLFPPIFFLLLLLNFCWWSPKVSSKERASACTVINFNIKVVPVWPVSVATEGRNPNWEAQHYRNTIFLAKTEIKKKRKRKRERAKMRRRRQGICWSDERLDSTVTLICRFICKGIDTHTGSQQVSKDSQETSTSTAQVGKVVTKLINGPSHDEGGTW